MKRTKRRISNRLLRFVRDWQSVREDRCEKIGGTGEEVFRREVCNRCGHIPPGRREVRCASFGRNSTLGVGSRARFIKIRPRVKEQACPSFCLASAQLNSTLGRLFHKSHRVRSTRARPRACTFFAGSKKMGRAFFFLFFFLFSKTLY